MSDIVTEHIRRLPLGSEPDAALWTWLRHELKRALKSRGLLGLSPSYLDYPFRNWEEAWDELVQDCYIRAIWRPSKTLKKYLKSQATVLPVVRANITFFLDERQERHDPIGRRLFRNIATALRDLHFQRRLALERWDGKKVVPTTVVQPSPDSSAEPVSGAKLREIVFGAEQLGILIPKLGEGGTRAYEAALSLVDGVLRAGIAAFRCGDLIDAIENEVRGCRTAGNPSSGGEPVWEQHGENAKNGAWVRTTGPDGSYEEEESRQAIILRIREAIAALEKQPQVRDRVRRLFDRLVEAAEQGEGPNFAEWGKEWGVPKSTVSDDVRVLRSLCGDTELANDPDVLSE